MATGNPVNKEDLERNKKTVIAFYSRSFNDKQPDDAVAKYVGSEYIQHNPDPPSGAAAFVKSATEFIAKFPQVSVEIKRVIAEDDVVVAHNLVKLKPEDCRMVGVDIFRFLDGKIVEHWMFASRYQRSLRTTTPCSDCTGAEKGAAF